MEELKLLIEMVANLPTLTVWVLAGYLAYKLSVIGSIYGLTRFGIDRLHDYLRNRHESRDIRPTISGRTISGCATQLESIIVSLSNISNSGLGRDGYIWPNDVAWLQEAVNEKKVKEAAK